MSVLLQEQCKLLVAQFVVSVQIHFVEDLVDKGISHLKNLFG